MRFLSIILCFIFILIAGIVVFKITELKNIEYKKPEILSNKRILIVYYSNGGNTKSVGEKLHSITGGDIKEIELIEKYPKNAFKMSKIVRNQIKEDFVPQIKHIDISDYDIIFTGSPIWNLSISLPLKAFLKSNNFENKILIPFFTCSGGVNKNEVANQLENLTGAKKVINPLFMFENGIFLVKEQIIKWLNTI